MNDSHPWEGSFVNYLDEILAVSRFEAFEYTYTSARSISLHSSRWTGAPAPARPCPARTCPTESARGSSFHRSSRVCASSYYATCRDAAAVADVQYGVADAAASAFWVTTERTEMTSFTNSFDLDILYLWAERTRSQSWLITAMEVRSTRQSSTRPGHETGVASTSALAEPAT